MRIGGGLVAWTVRVTFVSSSLGAFGCVVLGVGEGAIYVTAGCGHEHVFS